MTALQSRDSGDTTDFSSAAATHVGKVRLCNEDRFIDCPHGRLWAVADGMGGHKFGDLAATIAIHALAILAAGPAPITMQALIASLEAANKEIRDTLEPSSLGSGSTIAGLLIEDAAAHVFWLGDSRVYRLRGGRFDQLTKDHSVVQGLVDSGLMTQDQARCHPQANVITRALGVESEIDLDICSTDFQRGDRFLLCSDGLVPVLAQLDMVRHLSGRPQNATESLMRAALATAALDNITLVAVAID